MDCAGDRIDCQRPARRDRRMPLRPVSVGNGVERGFEKGIADLRRLLKLQFEGL